MVTIQTVGRAGRPEYRAPMLKTDWPQTGIMQLLVVPSRIHNLHLASRHTAAILRRREMLLLATIQVLDLRTLIMPMVRIIQRSERERQGSSTVISAERAPAENLLTQPVSSASTRNITGPKMNTLTAARGVKRHFYTPKI